MVPRGTEPWGEPLLVPEELLMHRGKLKPELRDFTDFTLLTTWRQRRCYNKVGFDDFPFSLYVLVSQTQRSCSNTAAGTCREENRKQTSFFSLSLSLPVPSSPRHPAPIPLCAIAHACAVLVMSCHKLPSRGSSKS